MFINRKKRPAKLIYNTTHYHATLYYHGYTSITMHITLILPGIQEGFTLTSCPPHTQSTQHNLSYTQVLHANLLNADKLYTHKFHLASRTWLQSAKRPTSSNHISANIVRKTLKFELEVKCALFSNGFFFKLMKCRIKNKIK